jgi:hypothetical protein
MYETTGDIMLFDLNTTTSGAPDDRMSKIPPFVPFIPGVSEVNSDGTKGSPKPRIYMNMYRMGFWNPDMSVYDDVNVLTDLQTCLESALIEYRLIIDKKADDVFKNPIIELKLTTIYSQLFYKALINVEKFPLSDFQLEMCYYLIAKFFLLYCIQETIDNPNVQRYAITVAAGKTGGTSADTYDSYEANLDMHYDTLSGFLNSLSKAFFGGKPIDNGSFTVAWIKQYGEGFALAPTYPNFLLHFLFSSIRSARLGGSSRLTGRRDMDFRTEDLRNLYNAVCLACR